MVTQLARVLIGIGAILVVVGALLLIADKLGLGKLPGDLTFRGKGVTVHFPIVTSILLSIVLTVLLNLWFRNR